MSNMQKHGSCGDPIWTALQQRVHFASSPGDGICPLLVKDVVKQDSLQTQTHKNGTDLCVKSWVGY
jgi:hypothetical protein